MKIQHNRFVIAGYGFLVVPILILSFSVFKAWHMSFTIDESASYLFYVHDTYMHIIECTRLEANNHILNSVLMKFFNSWLPLSELTLRLPNLIGHAMFLYATWKMIKDFKNAWFRLAIFLFLNLNPYLLDFFSLARGYALSWGLMTLSLYFLKEYIENPGHNFIRIASCFLCAGLGVTASFPLLGFYLALLIAYLTHEFIYFKNNHKKSHLIKPVISRVLIIIVFSSILLSYVLFICYKLLYANLLYFGGDAGFWKDTVISLIIASLYHASYASIGKPVLEIFVILIVLGAIILMVLPVFSAKFRIKQRPFFYIVFAILFIVVFSTIAQHYFLGTKFLILRTAGYMLVLFLMVAAYVFDFIIPNRFRFAAALIIGGISLFHFFETFNEHSVYEWRFDADTKKMMQNLCSFYQNTDTGADMFTTLYAYRKNAATCLFYSELYKYNWLMPVEYGKVITHTEDFYYLPDDTLNLLNGYRYKIIKHFADVKESLIENLEKRTAPVYASKSLNLFDTVVTSNTPAKFQQTATIQKTKCIRLDTGAFSPFISLDAMPMRHKSGIIILASAKVYFPSEKCGGLVIALYNKSGKILRWDSYDFGNYYLQDSGWMHIPFKLKVDKMYSDADTVRIFIWNTGKKPVYSSEIEAQITDF